MIESIGTYLPTWGTASARSAGPDEDVVTMAVAAGLQALASADPDAVRSVVLISRDLPLLEGGNSAALLAGLGLDSGTGVREQLGGAPAALEAVAEAPAATLVIGADTTPGAAGAAAVLASATGAEISLVSRVNRSLPVVTRDAFGKVTDYADPRLLRELGVAVSLEQAGLDGKVAAVAGLGGKEAAALTEGDGPRLPTRGASAPLFALAALAERRDGGAVLGGSVLAVEQSTVALATLAGGPVAVSRDEPSPQPVAKGRHTAGSDIAISLAAYERAFDAKLGLKAAKCKTCGMLSYPPRYRCLGCGSEEATEAVDLPREGEVYTCATVHVPVPGLTTPYSLVLVELGDSGVRLLVQLTGAPPGSVAIGDRGQLVFRKVADRSGVPDYGYGFLPLVDRSLAEVRA
jgi:uncharacterized OB-fold protein